MHQYFDNNSYLINLPNAALKLIRGSPCDWREFFVISEFLAHLMSSAHLVENVEASLRGKLESDAWLLEEIGVNISRGQLSIGTEMDSDKFSETRWVIISDGFCVT